jgi:pilus assembly protein Flp/PilA
MRGFMRRVFRDTRGGTAIEYGLIAALIVLGMIVALNLFAAQSISTWTNVSNKVATG